MTNPAWRRRNDGAFVAERDGLSMTVFQPAKRVFCNEMVQYVVTRGHKAVPNAIVGSGLAEGMTQAKRLAEAMAVRFTHDTPAGRLKVMVVDDDATVRNTLADTLRDDGYEVVEASSAEGALRRLERSQPPLVLVTDIDLGCGMTGLELAAEVCDLWSIVGIVLISGGDERLLTHSDEPIAFLPKPISTGCLLDRIATMFP